ncbi:hypothetical protein PHYPSEUDO_004426 [Phytophthora pseudosyringae]|uniref:Uncharacterized protein n=1 Tax=Phytophthora pseudosyringae TaxID=221518 RepID=A0A8T1WNW0_9STRA|nr:hypothetical protein PHYPSEUDO_004426 [Phytophthora pseudosyringae]
MNSAITLTLLALVCHIAAGSSSSGSSSAATAIKIATIVPDSFTSDIGDPHGNASSLSAGELSTPGESNDFVLLSSTTTSAAWLNVVPGYGAAADDRILYQTVNWELLEEGAQHEKFSTFWARFQALNSTSAASSSLTICTMVVNWAEATEASSSDDATAVKVEGRLKDNCGENDTIALAFTSAVTDTIAGYLEGVTAVNDAVALQDLNSFIRLETSEEPSTHDLVFVRLANNTCTGDESTGASAFSSIIGSEVMVTSLLVGEYCADMSLSHDPELMPPHGPFEDNDGSNGSNWKGDLRFIIPVGICMFLLGCAGLVYVIRDQKKKVADAETPKDEVKGIITSLPYVLTIHPVI